VSPNLTPARKSRRASSRELDALRRARITDATLELLYKRPAFDLTVAEITSYAHVSRAGFYGLFGDIEGCLLAVAKRQVRLFTGPAVEAYRSGSSEWRSAIRAGVVTLLSSLEQDRYQGHMLFELLSAGPMLRGLRADLIDKAADAIHQGASQRSDGPPKDVALTLAAGTFELLAIHLRADEPSPLTALYGTITGLIVLPYRGARVAREERSRPSPEVPVRSSEQRPARSVRPGLRLTYRTIRVLDAIAAQPGASNREIAQAAGIGDQGQISKLLKRLSYIGLTENDGAGAAAGTTNRWRLTDQGAQLQGVYGGERRGY
jgi:AcrR family transcriptional regulator